MDTYALSLYGRPQDRLSHVLVSEPFEHSIDFFYPTPYNHVLETVDGQLVNTATARVTLADIPFVSLRHGLPKQLLEGTAGFNETVEAARASLAPASLELHIAERTIKAGETHVLLRPAELAMLAVFARRTVNGDPPLQAPTKGVPDKSWSKRYLDEYRAIVGLITDTDATEIALRHGMDGEYFSQRKTRLETRLKTTLGPLANAYLIDDSGRRPRRFSLKLAQNAVRFLP